MTKPSWTPWITLWMHSRDCSSHRTPAKWWVGSNSRRGYSSVGRALRSQRRGQGFESPSLHPAHQARTLANRIVGWGSGLVAVLGPVERVGVDLGVEEHLEGPVVLDAEPVVFVDVDLGEEGLVAQASVGVVEPLVDVGAVSQESEGVVEVDAGVGAVAVVGVDTPVEAVEFTEDAVLLSFEDG